MAIDLAYFTKRLEDLRINRDRINEDIATAHKELKKLQPQAQNMKTVLFPIVRDFECLVGNKWTTRDVALLFGPCKQKRGLFHEYDTIYDILVTAGAFESKGQARKNWQGIKEVPTGYTELGPIGKSKLMIFIWNPSEEM